MLRLILACALMLPLPLRAQEDPSPLQRTDLMFQMAQTVQNSEAAQAVQQIALRLAAKAQGLEPLAIARRDLVERIARTRADTALDDAARRQRLEELDVALRVNDQALAKGFPAYLDIVAPDPLTIAEAQALLDPDEALIQMHQGKDWLTLWLISGRHVLWHRLPVTQSDAVELVAMYRETMGLTGTLRAAAALDDEPVATQPFNTRLAAILYQWLFAPFQGELAQYPHLMIVADKSWIGMPFATLLTDPAQAGSDPTPDMLRRASWMLRDHAITMLPSAVSLRAARANRPAPLPDGGLPTTTLLAIGDPVFTGTQGTDAVVRAATGTVDVSQLAPLPGTRREVRAIAAAFPEGSAQVLLGADASETMLETMDLSDRDVIVFATHGLIVGELQGLAEPALALTPPATITGSDDGLLTAGEVAGLTLTADWVVLSACNTAAGDGAGAEGLSGLARAFFAAGAQALLVSHWPVRDDAAARLTASAFAEMRAHPDLRKAEAMRRAMLALMDDDSDPSLSHPVAWAPFFVVGNR